MYLLYIAFPDTSSLSRRVYARRFKSSTFDVWRVHKSERIFSYKETAKNVQLDIYLEEFLSISMNKSLPPPS